MAVAKRKGHTQSVYIDDELINWVDEQVVEGTFASRSHAVTLALKQLKRRMSSEPFYR